MYPSFIFFSMKLLHSSAVGNKGRPQFSHSDLSNLILVIVR